MSEALTSSSLSESERRTLLGVAIDAIVHQLGYGQPPAVDVTQYPPALRELRAAFVTLEIEHRLRGCIGSLEARRPLVVDVAFNAVAAAFNDPRFPPVTFVEAPHLQVHISILTPSEPMRFASEEDLLAQLRPGVDGLVLEDGRNRGTFLPAVWETLPEPRKFLEQLKIKAGLPGGYWSETLRVSRYRAESVP